MGASWHRQLLHGHSGGTGKHTGAGKVMQVELSARRVTVCTTTDNTVRNPDQQHNAVATTGNQKLDC